MGVTRLAGQALGITLVLCAVGRAAELVQAIDADGEVLQLGGAAPFSIEDAVSSATTAAKAAQTAAVQAMEMAHTPDQKAEAKRLEASAKGMMTEVETKERKAFGDAMPKSAADIESEEAEKKEDAEKAAQAEAFVAQTKKDEAQEEARRKTIEKEEKAFKATAAPAPPAITMETVEKAVQKQHQKDHALLLRQKKHFQAELAAQKANLTQQAEQTLEKVKEKAEKDLATLHAQATFDKKHAEMQREQDALLREKQVTVNALLKSKLAANAQAAHIQAEAARQAASFVADAADKVAQGYPSPTTEHAAEESHTTVMAASKRSAQLAQMAAHAVTDAKTAKVNAKAAQAKASELLGLKSREYQANATLMAASTAVAKAQDQHDSAKAKLLAHKRKITTGMQDYERAQKELKQFGVKESKAKSQGMDALDRKGKAEREAEDAKDDSSKMKANEVAFKAAGEVRVAKVEQMNAETLQEKAKADANYKKMALAKLRDQAEQVETASIEAHNKQKAASEQHTKAKHAAQRTRAARAQAKADLQEIHQAEHEREQISKAELRKAAVEAKQDVHETTAKATAKAKQYALFKLQQTKLKAKEVSELTTKADHAKAVVDSLDASKKAHANQNDMGESKAQAPSHGPLSKLVDEARHAVGGIHVH